MNSCLYHGWVNHTRLTPTLHKFRYNLFLTCLDLDEFSEIFSLSKFWSNERMNFASFRRKDHLGDPDKPLKEEVQKFVEQETGHKPEGSVQIITHLSYMGYRFNPVSFYICRNHNNHIEFIVAEINNTPWRQQYSYVIDARNQAESHINCFFEKKFHISPFFPMDLEYKWKFSFTGEQLCIHMENWKNNEKIFVAHMEMTQQEMSAKNQRKILFKFPFMTLKVIWGIYWQAFRLWLKKTPFYPHPQTQEIGRSHAN